MKMKFALVALIIVAAVFMLTCGDDDDSTSSINNAPQINSLTANPDSVYRGEITAITCDAVDPQGNVLTYFWAVTAGTISGSGSNVTWTAPDSVGVFSINCKVRNAQGADASRKVDVYVVKPNVPEQGLIAYYSFATNANDLSGNNNDGTLLGGAAADGYLTIHRSSADAVALPYQVMDSLEDFTASAWVRIDTLQTVMGAPNTLISGANGSDVQALVFYYYAAQNQWGIIINTTNQPFDSDIVIEDLKWHHVTVMRNGSIARLYIDGNEVGNGITVIMNPLDIDPNRLMIGQYEPNPSINYSWAGDIDNLCFTIGCSLRLKCSSWLMRRIRINRFRDEIKQQVI